MKITMELRDETLRRAKSRAAERGIPLHQFITEAVEDKLKAGPGFHARPWMKLRGRLKHLRKKTKRINAAMEEAFETIDPEIWSVEPPR